jgi:hypothetical protein
MSTIRADNVAPSAGGTVKSLVRGVASAWANLDGTGTIALRDSLNVSSVVDNGVGDYSFFNSSAFANANYSVALGGDKAGAGLDVSVIVLCIHAAASAPSINSIRVGAQSVNSTSAAAVFDVTRFTFSCHGDLA